MKENYEKRIGFGTRFGAKIVDTVVIMVLALIIVGPIIGVIMGSEVAEASRDATSDLGDKDIAEGVGGFFGFLAGMVLSIPITWILYSLIEGLTGASPAKMMFGIKVANENGTEGDIKTYMMRWAFYNGQNIISIFALLVGISFLSTIATIYALIILVGCFLVFGEKKQSFHGKWSKTAVFNKTDIA